MNIFGFEIRKKGKAASPAPQHTTGSGALVYRPGMTVQELMANGTVNACASIIADAVAVLPLNVYKKDSQGNRKKTETDVSALFKLRTNFYQHPYSFKKQMMYHLLLKGNAFIFVERTGGEVSALYLLDPVRTRIKKKDGANEYYYEYTNENGTAFKYSSDDVIHIPAIVWSGVRGLSPIEYSYRTAGLGNTLDEYTANTFDGGIHSKLLLTVPKEERGWSEADSKALSQAVVSAYGGAENSHKPFILSKGITATPLNLGSNEDNQLVQNRTYAVKEIAKIFRVPLSMLGESDAKYNNNEQQTRNFLTNTLQPWLVLIEQALSKLLPYPDRGKFYFEFDRESMIQSDTQTKIELLIKEMQSGVLTPNEVRKKLNLEEYPEEIGGKPLSAVNISYMENALKADEEPEEDSSKKKDSSPDSQN